VGLGVTPRRHPAHGAPRPARSLALSVENLLLRQQLAVALRARPRPRLRRRDRVFWVVARRLCADWRRHLVLVRPETGVREVAVC
jgi:hypothetical protein